MKVFLSADIEFEFFQIEELKNAQIFAENIGGQIYSWKTIGNSNWLEKELSIADVLGIVVLPNGLPDLIDLPQDTDD